VGESLRLVVRTEWTIRTIGGRQVPMKDQAVGIEDGRIADATTDPPSAWQSIDIAGGIAFRGFINLHNHTINAPHFPAEAEMVQ
jgi:cytosine/adenosine deaminase-related metal-dependent hydrolase